MYRIKEKWYQFKKLIYRYYILKLFENLKNYIDNHKKILIHKRT